MASKNQNLILCPKCGKIPLIGMAQDGKNQTVHITCETCKEYDIPFCEYLNKLSETSPSDEVSCKEHKFQKYLSYCMDCKKYLCQECCRDEHAAHYELSLEKFLSENKKDETKQNKIDEINFMIDSTCKKYKDVYVEFLKGLINKIETVYQDFVKRNKELVKFYDMTFKNYSEGFPHLIQIKNYYKFSGLDIEKFNFPENLQITNRLENLDELLQYYESTNVKIKQEGSIDEELQKYISLIPLEFAAIKQGKNVKENEPVNQIIKLKNGEILTVAQSKAINIYTNDFELKVSQQNAHDEMILNACELPNGRIVTCSKDKTIKIWDYDNVSKISCFKQINYPHGNGSVYKVIPLTNNRFASIGNNSSINIYDANETYEKITELKGHNCSIINILQMSNGVLVSAGNYDSCLKFWNLDNYSCIHTMEKIDVIYNNSMAEVENNRLIVGEFNYIKLIDCNTYKVINSVYDDVNGNPMCFCVLRDKSILVGFDDSVIETN